MACPPPPRIEQPDAAPSSATHSYDPVGIFWDYENCAPSASASGYNIANNVRGLANQFGAVNTFKAYLELPDKPSPKRSTLRSELQSCGLSLTDCPHHGKNSVDFMMIGESFLPLDIMAFINDNHPPATVILISGDRDFAYLLSIVRWRKYNVILISNTSMTHESLTSQASVVYDWKSDILKARPPSKPPLFRSQTLYPAASLTTPQNPDIIPESGPHPVGPANERVTLATQPLILSPRPPNIPVIDAIHTTSVTLPLDFPSAELEVTPMPEMAGIPTRAASTNVPMEPTSDDRVVAGLAGGSVDPTPPVANDSVDKADVYSPVFNPLEMASLGGGNDTPSSPGCLLFADEDSSIESIIDGLRDMDPSPEIVGGEQVESTSRGPPASLPAIPSHTLHLTFTPKAPHTLWAEVTQSPSKADARRGFEDLVIVLSELSAYRDSAPRFSTVFSLWRNRKPGAFEAVSATRFKAYLQLAESAGILTLERGRGGDGSVILRIQWEANSGSPSRPTPPPHSGSRFHDLIQIPNDLRLAGDPEPQFSIVGSRLPRKNPSIYEDAGVRGFGEYVKAAVKAGVVTVRGKKKGDGRLKLCPAYCSPPVPSQTLAITAKTPPIRPACNGSSFAPLVGFLKSKQSTSDQPISYSEAIAHLVSTYPDLDSLCTSVPGVTTVGQYIDAAIASGLVCLARGTTASRDALVCLRVGSPDGRSLPTQRSVSPAPPPTHAPPQEIVVTSPSVNLGPKHFRDMDPSGTIGPVLRACECKICTRSPVLLASQTPAQRIVDGRQVEPSPRESPTLPTASLSAVPPPELSPTHKTSLDALAPIFVPGTLHLSRAKVTTFPSNPDPEHSFEDLNVVLGELFVNGGSTHRFSTVFSLWRERGPDASKAVSAAQFAAYLQRAEAAGIVTLEQRQDGDGWVTLRQQCKINPNGPLHRHLAGSRFRNLIQILNELRIAGDPEPKFFTVGPRLTKNNPSIYEEAGVRRFEEYVQAAADAGVVTIRKMTNGDGSLKLCPAYCSSPVCSSTPTSAASTPPAFATSTTPPFTPLVEFLKSKQLTSGQPTSSSEVFAHLVLTLGYADFVSLCTSVPGVTTFGQYINAAIASGLVSLVGGTTASGSTLVSSRGAGAAQGAWLWLPDSLSPLPPTQRCVATTPLLPLPPSQEITVFPPSANPTSGAFRSLIAVLTELRASTGETSFWFSNVIPLLLNREPNAYASVGVTRFIDYVTLAMEDGIVTAGWMDHGSDGWVALNDPRPGGLAVPLHSSGSLEGETVTATAPFTSSNGGGVDPRFVDLVETMGKMWMAGEANPLLSFVRREFLKDGRWRARTLATCGVKKFKAYAKLAKDAGIVEIHHNRGEPPRKKTMSLNPAIRMRAGYYE